MDKSKLAELMCEALGEKVGERTQLVRFESEAQFIAHAKRLIAMKPGDVVRIQDGRKLVITECANVVKRPSGVYLDEDMELSGMQIAPGSIAEFLD